MNVKTKTLQFNANALVSAFESWQRDIERFPAGAVGPFVEQVSPDGCKITGFCYTITSGSAHTDHARG